MCSASMDYIEVTRPLSQHDSIHKPDEVFLLPHKQTGHDRSTSVDSNVKYSDGDGLFDELDPLMHIDTDMSSLLHDIDSRLVCHSGASDDSCADTEQVSRDSEAASENESHHRVSRCQLDDGPTSQSFHEYDTVYIPHNDAAAMDRRVDNETSYVRTVQSQRNCSPYEEVCYGVRPLLLSGHPPSEVHQLPAVPPRMSSATDSHVQNSDSSEHTDKGQADGTDWHGDLSW